MELLVKRFNFMTAQHDQREEFSDELRRNSDKYEAVVDEKDLLGAFRVYRKQTCRPDFPGESEDQCYFAKDVLGELMEWSAKLRDDGKIKSLSRIHDFCFEFLHDLIEQGPGTSHSEIIEKMMDNSDFEFGEYYGALRGEKLKSHVRFLMREYRTRETGPDRDRFHISIDHTINNLMGPFEEEALAEAQTEFIELYMYMELSFLNRPKEVKDIHHRMSQSLWYKYDRNVFKDIKDPVMIKKFLKRLEDIICKTNLTTAQSGEVLKKIQDILEMLLSAVSSGFFFDKVHVEILDFVANICDKKAGSPIHDLVKAVGYFYYHLKDGDGPPIITGNSALFESMTAKMTKFLDNLEDHTIMRVKFVDAAVSEVFLKAMAKGPEHQKLMLALIKACLRIKHPNTAKAAYNCMRECENKFKWKGFEEDIKEMLDLVACARIYGSDDRKKKEFAEYYNDFCDYLARQIKRDRIVPQLLEKMVEFGYKMLDTRDRMIMECGKEIVGEIEFNGKKHKDLIMSVFTDLIPYLKDPTFPWTGEGFDYGRDIVTDLASKAVEAINTRTLTTKDYDTISYFVTTAMKGDFIDPDQNIPMTVHYLLYCSVGTKFLSFLDDQEKVNRCLLLIREIVNLMFHEYSEIVEMASNQVLMLSQNGAKSLAPFFGKIMESYADTENSSLLYPISLIYPYNPAPLAPHFQEIFELIDSQQRSMILMILGEVAKLQPEIITDENVKSIIEEMYQGDERQQVQYLTVLDSLSKKSPEKIVPHLDTLMKGPINTQYGAMYQMTQLLKNVVIKTEDEALAERVMVFLEKKVKEPEDQMVTAFCLNEMRVIGGKWRPLLEKRKKTIVELRDRSTVQTTKDSCTFIIDVLEGRSLKSLSEELSEMKEDIDQIDTRVTQTELGLVLVNQEVGKQKEELTTVKADVSKQGKKVEKLETSVDETKAKVEELDGKTLSHAPFWSRDVAKIMNKEDIVDWRLLSHRLGYSNDDIRSWAQMNDPCMAMLNEWYATRKTSEATFAVLNALQEMDRMDAAIIVENAMKMAEATVEDEEFDYPEPPEVFLSYQWGIQNEVKLLKQHLEKAGFTCWMDIGQMGGGDKLFEKIDKGIRGAKLIISCVTEKYAKSPNCNREVNLSVGLGKPIIPLLMEKLSWPPPGSMGPIFSEYLFIRFFTRPGEETGDQRYWSAAKFQELLMQLNYNNVQPDGSKVEKEYKDWWCPVVEEIKIEKKEMKAMTPASQQKQEEVEAGTSSPDVFISYQWGKQKQIQKLYKTLTKLGFTCWMDIHQMGGGDSLYDKIDRGVRGAKVVLTCVTTKYALSANCRREVSLADALKKPIVPLLLEKMTWPPTGPMSMVFTQLLYITFAKDESVQERWDGEKFEELKVKLDQYVPDIIKLVDEEPVEEDTKKQQKREETPPPPPQPSKKEKPRTPEKQKRPEESKPERPQEQSRQQPQQPPPQQPPPQQPPPQQHQPPPQQQQYQPHYAQPAPQRRQEYPPATEKKSKSCILL